LDGALTWKIISSSCIELLEEEWHGIERELTRRLADMEPHKPEMYERETAKGRFCLLIE